MRVCLSMRGSSPNGAPLRSSQVGSPAPFRGLATLRYNPTDNTLQTILSTGNNVAKSSLCPFNCESCGQEKTLPDASSESLQPWHLFNTTHATELSGIAPATAGETTRRPSVNSSRVASSHAGASTLKRCERLTRATENHRLEHTEFGLE